MDVTAVAAAFAALVAVGGALYYAFRWQPVRKSWCVILYHVSRETNAHFDWPNPGSISGVNALDLKLDQVVGALDNLPCSSLLTFVKSTLLGPSAAPHGVNWDDVHVVYRAVWNDAPFRPPGKRARLRIVTWRPGAPSVPDDQILSAPVGSDRDGFVQWVYQNCPADHYALFYWGHSIGPGGLFELNTSVKFPPLPGAGALAPANLIDFSTTLRILQDLRQRGTVNMVGVPTGPAPSPGGSSTTSGPSLGPGAMKADVVLFQDCWMNTLETAFELQDLARYVVSSQSIVPIGYTYSGDTMTAATGPVWPYDAMIARMLADPNNFIDALANQLQAFYSTPAARAPFPVATVSVLDLGPGSEVQDIVAPPLRHMVAALSMLSKPYDADYRWAFLQGGGEAFHIANGRLEYGDWALRDVVRLCRHLAVAANHPSGVPPAVSNAVLAAAANALAAIDPTSGNVYSLIRTAFTVPTSTAAGLFEGLSIFWIPGTAAATPPNDRYLANQVDNSTYAKLRLVQDTKPAGGPADQSWATFAFEQR